MSRLVVYPFNDELSAFCRFSNLVREYNDIVPICPKGFGFAGNDAAKCDGGLPTGTVVYSDVFSGLSNADAIYLDVAQKFLIDAGHYAEIIEAALVQIKRVLLSDCLYEYMNNQGYEIDSKRVEVIKYPTGNTVDISQKKLFEIPVPCISILGAGDKCNKFELQLGISDYFSKRGYKVCLLGTKRYTSLFGYEALPDFLFKMGDQSEKILKLNHYIYEKVRKEDIDLLVIGCPGGILPETPFVFNGHGEMAFLIGNAIQADASVLSLYAAPYNSQSLEQLENICKYRHNARVKRINLACKNMSVDQATMGYKYVTMAYDFVQREITPSVIGNSEIFVGLAEGEMDRLGQSLECELSHNI